MSDKWSYCPFCLAHEMEAGEGPEPDDEVILNHELEIEELYKKLRKAKENKRTTPRMVEAGVEGHNRESMGR